MNGFQESNIYWGESNVSQYFGHVKHNSAYPDSFMNVTTLAWYFSSSTHRIFLYDLESMI